MDPLLIIMLLAVGAMFLLTSRTRKQQRKAGEFRQELAVGDDVMTHGGLFGTIVDIDGDVITLESPSGGRTDWLRAAIAKLAEPPFAAPAEEGDALEDEYLDEFADEFAEPGDRDVTEPYDTEPSDTEPSDTMLDEAEQSDVEKNDVDERPTPADAPSDDAASPDASDGTPDEPRRP